MATKLPIHFPNFDFIEAIEMIKVMFIGDELVCHITVGMTIFKP